MQVYLCFMEMAVLEYIIFIFYLKLLFFRDGMYKILRTLNVLWTPLKSVQKCSITNASPPHFYCLVLLHTVCRPLSLNVCIEKRDFYTL